MSDQDSKNKQAGLTIEASLHEGPIPSPDHFAAYEEVLPGSAERLFVMAEKEQELYEYAVKAAIKHESRQQIGAQIISGGYPKGSNKKRVWIRQNSPSGSY